MHSGDVGGLRRRQNFHLSNGIWNHSEAVLGILGHGPHFRCERSQVQLPDKPMYGKEWGISLCGRGLQ